MIGCRTCALLKAELDRAHAEKKEILDRLLAATAPHALAMVRYASTPSPTTAYDPETGHMAVIDGKEVPIVYEEGVPRVPIGPGSTVSIDDYRRQGDEARKVQAMLDRMDQGETPRMEEEPADEAQRLTDMFADVIRGDA